MRQREFEEDLRFTRNALADARQYNTDTDHSGARAEKIYQRLARARRFMEPYATDGSARQSELAIDYLREITSILSYKIGPASRREFPEQRDPRRVQRSRRSGR